MSTKTLQRGKYRLIAEIGRGGMAEVYLALLQGDLGFNKLVVLKQIREDMADDAELLGMFLDEARLAARLRHPNVVETHEVAQEDGHTYMAMEYLEGQPLHRIFQRLHRSGGLPLAIHLRILADLLAGVHHAHELRDWDDTPLGVVHRDVTPQNVFVTYTGVVKLVDFGIAKVKDAQTLTRVGIVKGKIAYLAPEQARREDLDRRVDIFAVGVMLWEAVTKTRPWKGKSDQHVLERLMAGQFPSARAANADIAPELEAILAKALAPERDDRYATAAEFQAALEEYLESRGDRVDMRELGKVLANEFAEDRELIHARLEEALRVDPVTGEMAVGNLPKIAERASSPSQDRTVAPGMPSRVEAATRAVSAAAVQHPNRTPSVGTSLPGLAAAVAPRPISRIRPALAIGVLAAAAFALSLWAPWRAPSVGGAVQTASVAPVESVAVPPVASRIALNIRAFPQQARILLDGAPLESNPFAGVLPADGKLHELQIQAPGYVTRTQTIKLDEDMIIELSLVASEPVPEVGGAAKRGPFPGPTDTRGKGHRSLDGKNPYER
ncbi:MAG: serine/threonine-protein kinase [Byssovorax sp.]